MIFAATVTSGTSAHPIPVRKQQHCLADRNQIQGGPMKKIFSTLALACILAASLSAFAQDQMKQDDKQNAKQNQKQNAMQNDKVKDGQTKAAPKKTNKVVRKDSAKKDEMKQDNTKNDQMKQN
jgi:pentapeptide MXKDX repeat protein